MRKLYVRFAGDNDFGTTVRAFVEAIAPRIFYDDWKEITKEQIVNLFNTTSFSLYCLHQNRYQFFKEEERLKDYLQIEEKDVMFDDESNDFLNSPQVNHDGCLAKFNHNFDIIYITI